MIFLVDCMILGLFELLKYVFSWILHDSDGVSRTSIKQKSAFLERWLVEISVIEFCSGYEGAIWRYWMRVQPVITTLVVWNFKGFWKVHEELNKTAWKIKIIKANKIRDVHGLKKVLGEINPNWLDGWGSTFLGLNSQG